MDTAALPLPQSLRLAMCPPRARTASELVAVNRTRISVLVSPTYFPHELGLVPQLAGILRSAHGSGEVSVLV
ncbi:hypothetical protein [Enemella dayhoffiae]|uniref:hypothetical protein n=1 Tax=Enemella dayhoffiae TaxID=2016507 RepID=UPI00113FDE8F|nr:hypothetical protein [Enemella dayhoffiae]